jgi:cell division septation protein DedD
MLTIFPQPQTATSGAASFPEPLANEGQIVETAPSEGDSEWVVGPPQMAALAFLAIAAIALFSGFSYLAGKAMQADPLPPIQLKLAQPQLPEPSIGDQFASYAGTTLPPKAQDAPIFSDPAPGKSYIQMAAVEKGVAAVFAEGLRAHQLTAFVAPGPSPTIFRVLIGPVSDTQAYKATKQELDKIGLSTFMRQYEK